MSASRESGFTLVDMLVGVAIGVLALGLLALAGSRLVAAASSTDARANAQAATERISERLSTEAASAEAVFVPAADVNGTSNADGHEVDFYAEDASHRAYAWAYTYDADTKMITRSSYAPGSSASAGEQLGPLDSFSATTIAASQIASSDPLFAGASVSDVSYAIPGLASARAGNALVKLHLVAAGVDRTDLLATQTAPTSFTVVVTYTPSPAPASTATPTPIPLTVATP